ncbi:hypothetical protein [Streptomyces sp. CB00316]|uniref:hypothetical protein n=1 Tax=Streptomyces sp. CB00316 TaxID=1703932 RepID=UPI00093CC6A2
MSAGSFAEQERYVKDSFKIVVNSANAHGEVKQQWKDTGYDVGDALFDASGADPAQREEIDAWAKEHLKPSPETVAQAEEPRWGESR